MDDHNLNRAWKTMMNNSFFRYLAAVILMVVLLTASGPVVCAGAAEYHNPAVNGTENPSYWLDRGALLATYGNYPAAIKAYKKALALDPDLSNTYFNLALAHFGNGEPGQALATINQALIMDPENGRYLYGRGWILLQEYGADRADADFQKAARLGDQDALNYLEGLGVKP
jgi:tetratricopeptide (TPR) repeat protein